MNIFYWILAVFLYLAIGAIIGGLTDFGDDIFCSIIAWPLYVVIMVIRGIFLPFIKLGEWISEKRHRYQYKRKLKKAGIRNDRT